MTAQFRDLDDFFDGRLALPVGGRMYHVPEPDALTGVYVQRIFGAGLAVAAGRTPAGPLPVLNDAEELDLVQRVLGPVYDELVADGVSWPRISHVGTTALVWVAFGSEMAARYWETRTMGEAMAPANRAARRSTSTAGASTTKRPASGSGTRSPRKSSPAKPAKASRGARS